SLYIEMKPLYNVSLMDFDKEIFDIANTMSGLRHLAFSGIAIGSIELLAIIDCGPEEEHQHAYCLRI
ncbi:hypothetical protein RYX36_028458, partial [Vicia faba]